ncbi:methyltransferase domain-containing protein [Aliagarivorans marinus]|uniref:methyltransferase domain-containing protein n=1 Tax=Aliagarivorans marinus TaxID=561965 RepID=UPI00041C9931|nr:methyltransferase domain-containing protein [Aliagarivorans marinus]
MDAAVNHWLLELYAEPVESPLFKLRQSLFRHLQTLLPFDWAIWWQGEQLSEVSSLEYAYSYSQGQSVNEIWQSLSAPLRRQVCLTLSEQQGRAISLRQLTQGPAGIYDSCLDCAPLFNIEDALLCLLPSEDHTGKQLFCISRAQLGACFSAAERQVFEQVVRHLQAAYKLSVYQSIHTQQGHKRSHGLVDSEGRVIELSSSLQQRLNQHGYIEGAQLRLPVTNGQQNDPIAVCVAVGSYPMGDEQLLVCHCEGARYLTIATRNAFSTLSRSQQTLALLLAGGEDDRQIARQLGVSEQTVRNQLSKIYQLMEVDGRAALIAMLYQISKLPLKPQPQGGEEPDIKDFMSNISHDAERQSAQLYLESFSRLPGVVAGKQWTLKQLKTHHSDVLLEVGPGTGQDLRCWSESLSVKQIVTLDNSALMLQSAVAGLGEKITAINGCAMAIPLADDCVDAVHAERLLCNLSQPIQALTEMYRVCRPGGKLVLTEADYKSATVISREPETNAQIIELVRGLIASPEAHQVIQQFVKQRQLRVIAEQCNEVVMPSLAEFDLYSGLTATLNNAIEQGLLSSEDAARWWLDAKGLERRGAFKCVVPFHQWVIAL